MAWKLAWMMEGEIDKFRDGAGSEQGSGVLAPLRNSSHDEQDNLTSCIAG
jgi:hypothetical protein